jgi:hypothetical protein
MSEPRIPIVILGGSDRRPGVLPEDGRNQHPLSGYKGAMIRIDGRPLVSVIAEGLLDSGAFGPVYISGPRRIYGPIDAPATLIDTNGTFGQNIRASLESVQTAHPGSPIAFITCDVLVETENLRELAAMYRAEMPVDFWFPLVRVSEDRSELGASGWKPTYRIPPEEGAPAVPTLPGHLVIADPEAMRTRFIYRLFQIGYSTRNRPIHVRRKAMVAGVIGALLFQDFLHLVGLRAPSLTWTVLSSALPTARLLKEGRASRARLERTLRKLFVKSRHRRHFPERRVILPIVDVFSLARDLDTFEEVRQWGGEVSENSA